MITRLDANYGPRFTDDKVSDEMIEERFYNGEPAANDIRRAEEEWLYKLCQGFGVDIRMRATEEPYAFSRSELADALQRFLNKNELEPPMVPGFTNRFLSSLKKGGVENFGSHFQDTEYGDNSTGDEKERWEEFKFFRSRFICPKCSRKSFTRLQNFERPVCSHKSCGTQFEFKKFTQG